MRVALCPCLAVVAAALLGLPAPAQQPPPAPPAAPAALPAGAVATVNGQPIPAVALERGLKRVPPDQQAEARPLLLNSLVDNLLIEQYLRQLSLQVDQKEVDAKFEQVRKDILKEAERSPGMTYDKVLQQYMLTEAELKTILTEQLRWEKYADQQATDKALHDFFDGNKEIFDGTQIHARHILITPASNDAQAADQAKAQLLLIKQQIEQQVAAGMAKQPPAPDTLAKEQARVKLLDEAFSAAAREKSACPSKQQGGDIGTFYRVGTMVEPFAKAAFALKPYQMSDVVRTQFGFHLILVLERAPGKDVKFDELKEDVKVVFSDWLHESLAAQLRPRATIVLSPPPAAPAKPAPPPKQ